jgi:hypothetical protein
VSRLPGTVAFGLGTLALLAAGLLLVWIGLERRDPLRLGFAVVVLGGAAMLGYETFAYGTRLDPTISGIAAFQFARHPIAWLSVLAAAMVVIGSLSHHFTFAGHRTHWYVLGIGLAGLFGGWFLTGLTGWVPELAAP